MPIAVMFGSSILALCPALFFREADEVSAGDRLELDLAAGQVRNLTTGANYAATGCWSQQAGVRACVGWVLRPSASSLTRTEFRSTRTCARQRICGRSAM